MATVNQIVDAARVDADIVARQIKDTSDQDPNGTNKAVQAKLDMLRLKHGDIRAEAAAAAAATGDLAVALKALLDAGEKLTKTANIMKNLTGFLNNVDEFAGYAQGAVDTLRSLPKA